MTDQKTLVLIDGKSVFYRGYYAMPNLSTREGVLTGGVYGFASIAMEILSQIKPDYVAIAWDKAKTNIRRRVAMYPEYKANRHAAPPGFYAQIPTLHELLDAFHFPLYELDDYEADDIIGTFDKLANAQNLRTIMVSSDLDLLQLIDENTELYALKKGFTNIEKFDVAATEQKYALRVDQFLDLKSLKGDTSDNIPGVPGIGEKTAVSLLQEFETLDGVFANLDKIKGAWREKLETGRDLAYLSKELAKIWCDAPLKLDLAKMDVTKVDVEKLRAELEKLEFKSLIRRLPELLNKDPEPKETGDNPGLFFTLSNGKIVVNDGKVLAEKLLRENADAELPEIEFDVRLAGFLLGRVEKVANLEELKKLYEMQRSELESMSQLYHLAQKLDFPMQNLLAKIQARGVKVDVQKLTEISNDLMQIICDKKQKIWDHAGYEFNISSAPQLSDALFKIMQLPSTGIKKSIRGYFSTGRKELDKLRGLHPIIGEIIEYREVTKLKNTYTDALPELVDKNGYLHTIFHQDATSTGRLSSSNPNLQNIPVRTDLGKKVRQAFVASPGKILISADYSQFELRLAAAMSHDEKLIEMFNDDNADVHSLTAAEAFNISVDQITPAQRRAAKIINFGVLYGMSPHGLSIATDMNMTDAKRFINEYFELRKPIRDFLDRTIQKAKTDGYIETLFGRRRNTPDVNSPNFIQKSAAERSAANMPIQGTEADLMKMAMLRVEREIDGAMARQILQIHDSIMMECAPECVDEVSAKLKQIMENIYPNLGVRLKVDIKTGQSWAEL
ncbi:DNA polymerase [Candidatus Saccharibacteria bacterium]|nr:DNA polymerase [Candidatus Saccharibacteria bacterium]MCL1962893.1 DNA polymerase [Candidatus Saccharibacteria bacterium]